MRTPIFKGFTKLEHEVMGVLSKAEAPLHGLAIVNASGKIEPCSIYNVVTALEKKGFVCGVYGPKGRTYQATPLGKDLYLAIQGVLVRHEMAR